MQEMTVICIFYSCSMHSMLLIRPFLHDFADKFALMSALTDLMGLPQIGYSFVGSN